MAVAQALASAPTLGSPHATLLPSICPAKGRCSAPNVTTQLRISSCPPISISIVGMRKSTITAISPPTNGTDSASNGANGDQPSLILDRRELLAAGIAGISLLSPTAVEGVPIKGPDVKTCHDATTTNFLTQEVFKNLQCCPPDYFRTTKPEDFKFPPHPGPVRTRQPAHMVDQAYIDKYNVAYGRMIALDKNDPRSLEQQARLHCSYCNGAFYQAGSSNVPLQIHFNWLFFPWHRWYLYFHERILASLLGDPTFALPFWNWDNTQTKAAYQLPAMFNKKGSAAYDLLRDPAHLPPTLVDLNIAVLGQPEKPDDVIKGENLNIMHTSVSLATSAKLFMGNTYVFDSPDTDLSTNNSGGSLENGPHNVIHGWVGSPTTSYGQDMGNLASSGYDPVFYCHHSNVDRLWDVWSKLPDPTNKSRGLRQAWTDPDFLNSEFLFFDENSKMVRVKVADTLDITKFGYKYTSMTESDNEWINYKAPIVGTAKTVASSVVSSFARGAVARAAEIEEFEELGPVSKDKDSKKITTPFSSSVARQEMATLSDDQKEEILVLQTVTIPAAERVHFDVFINLPNADENTSVNCAEYVGSFNNIPHFGMEGMKPGETMERVTDVRFAISEQVSRLGLKDKSKIVVTVVPKGTAAAKNLSVKGLVIDYE